MTADQPIKGLANLHLDQVKPSPNNVRDRLTDLDGLAVSIREQGLIQPIVVQEIPGTATFQIVAGHRRHAAARIAGLKRITAVVRRDMLPDEELLAVLVENGQRADLDPIEEARAFKRLQTQTGMTQGQVGAKVGRSIKYVSDRLALLTLPVEEQEQLRAGLITKTAATSKARVDAGLTRPSNRKGKKSAAHLSIHHSLGARARARCQRLAHKSKGAGSVGGIACGECWESVIRADERDHQHTLSATQGRCVLCGHRVETQSTPQQTDQTQELSA